MPKESLLYIVDHLKEIYYYFASISNEQQSYILNNVILAIGIRDSNLGHHSRLRLPVHVDRLLQPEGSFGLVQTRERSCSKVGVRRTLPVGTTGRRRCERTLGQTGYFGKVSHSY